MQPYHIPVLVAQVLEYLIPASQAEMPQADRSRVYVDATFGGGGHTQAILEADPKACVIAFDWDADALELNKQRLEELFPGRIQFVWGNFAQLEQHLKKLRVTEVDGILADFGTSQYQIKAQEGFSFMVNSPLDMRMSPGHYQVTAATLVNTLSEKELTELLWEYGQERHAREIARAIVFTRRRKPLRMTSDLVDVVLSVVPRTKPGIHPATQTFQALRIVVNHELENIRSFLTQAMRVLRRDGHVVCISFHSLEDRLVKQFFQDHKAELTNLTKHVVVASDSERLANPSSRSAKLRAAARN